MSLRFEIDASAVPLPLYLQIGQFILVSCDVTRNDDLLRCSDHFVHLIWCDGRWSWEQRLEQKCKQYSLFLNNKQNLNPSWWCFVEIWTASIKSVTVGLDFSWALCKKAIFILYANLIKINCLIFNNYLQLRVFILRQEYFLRESNHWVTSKKKSYMWGRF